MAELIDRRDIVFAHKVEGSEEYKEGFLDGAMCVLDAIDEMSTIEAKPVVHAHWISASWEEDEENGIENTYSDEFICSNCKEHLYFPDAIEKEDIGFSFCPSCGAQMDEEVDDG